MYALFLPFRFHVSVSAGTNFSEQYLIIQAFKLMVIPRKFVIHGLYVSGELEFEPAKNANYNIVKVGAYASSNGLKLMIQPSNLTVGELLNQCNMVRQFISFFIICINQVCILLHGLHSNWSDIIIFPFILQWDFITSLLPVSPSSQKQKLAKLMARALISLKLAHSRMDQIAFSTWME